MKKSYTKPVLYIESFELLEHIAGGCLTGDNFAGAQHRDGNCGYDIGSIVIFTGGVSDCDNSDFNSMVSFAVFDITGLTTMEIAQRLGLECYNSFYDGASQFFAS